MSKDHPHSETKSVVNRHDYIPAAGFDMFLPGYDALTRLLGMRPAYDEFVAQVELFDGVRVLEIGCGTGNVMARLKRAEPGAQLTGMDPDPRALARAGRKFRGVAGVRFDRGYAQEVPYADKSFDRVLSSMMLHHLDDDVKTAALSEVFRVLRPGGSMHVVDIVGHHAASAHDDSVIPTLLKDRGFEGVAELGSRRLRFVGPVHFYRGIRPL
ncbi:class I SAM-dependent methyltransferase [Mycolicibacterium sp. P9-64]|uniref:class I SAM-dependent methyltransferase n=1 Tax=Mycolicibacterium sp. P9-64 TaxID=2024612 RepID=UPI0011EBB5BA|nr:class I SAM-dependent methyltransferase [Mycolicibacterium sp. P9-64]KAA0085639.1 class I SAM-dependent methyltransferase [Mycolicibacterium sp. P9-64]